MNDTVQENSKSLKSILDYLMEKRGFDFSGYHPAMLERRIGQRLTAAACKDFSEYLSCLRENPAETDHLLDVITINVSRFFRNTLTFELIADRILPAIILEKARLQDRSLRIWCTGCAKGEEPYSLAILIRELLEKEELDMNIHLFATDIDSKSLKSAEMAVYPLASVDHMKYRLLRKYFIANGELFSLIPKIKKLVTFSRYDMLDKKHGVPPDSIFGNFDLVLCRNLLIYFNTEYQDMIFSRLHRSLADNSYLILGEAEEPTLKYRHYFDRIFDFSQIYRKRY